MKRQLLLLLSLASTASWTAHANDDYWAEKQLNYENCVPSVVQGSGIVEVDILKLHDNCIQPEAGPDLFVEATTMLFPDTTGRLLLPRNDGDEPSLTSFVLRNFLYKIGDTIATTSKANNSSLDVYIQNDNPFFTETAVYKYKTQGAISLAVYGLTLERALTAFMYIMSTLALISIGWTLLRRVILTGVDSQGVKAMLATTAKEAPPVLLALYLIYTPNMATMPLIGEFFVTALVLGALGIGAMTSVLTPTLHNFFAQAGYTAHIDEMASDYAQPVTEELNTYVDNVSDAIIGMDIALSQYLNQRVGGARKAGQLSTSINERLLACIEQPYWQIHAQHDMRCNPITRMTDTLVSKSSDVWQSNPTGTAMEQLDSFMRNEMNPSSNQHSAFTSDIVVSLWDLAYKKAKIKKEAICAYSPALADRSALRNEWFCLDSDHRTGGLIPNSSINSSYLEYLSDRSTAYGQDRFSALSTAYYAEPDELAGFNKVVQQIIEGHTPTKAQYIEMLKGNVDVKSFTNRGILSNIFNSIALGDSVNGATISLNQGKRQDLADYLSNLQKTGPGIKRAVDEWADQRRFSDEGGIIKQFTNFRENNAKLPSQATAEPQLLDRFYSNMLGITPSKCARLEQGCLDHSINPISRVTALGSYLVSSAISIDIGVAFFKGLMPSNSTVVNTTAGSITFLTSVASGLGFVFLAFSIVPFFLYGIYATLTVLYRAVVFMCISTLVVIQFITKKQGDHQFDNANIFVPAKISGMLMRVLVDFIALGLTLILGLLMTYLATTLAAIFIAMAIESIELSYTLSIASIQSFALAAVANVFLIGGYIYSIYKASQIMPYANDKLTEFTHNEPNITTDQDNEAEAILGVLTPIMGFLRVR